MLSNRAQEIINTPKNIEVLYHDKAVWLEKVSGNTVKVKDLSSNTSMEVPVSELVETGIVK